ncbi:MAG: nucleoside triphosphate pyrophosphohydrolase [Patescibacteria group bacterium]
MTLHYNKLVRDNVPNLARQQGEKVSVHYASDEEFWLKLKQKLQEEINEFAKLETMDSLADVLEVIDAICEFKKFDVRELNAVRENKAIEHGTFTKRVILDETEPDPTIPLPDPHDDI